jgi:hypothetical protein
MEPLINLKVGSKEKEITFLVHSGAAKLSVTMASPLLGVAVLLLGAAHNFWSKGRGISCLCL